jgi:hypothetical protein
LIFNDLALTGLGFCGEIICPRALPWAMRLSAFSAKRKASLIAFSVIKKDRIRVFGAK